MQKKLGGGSGDDGGGGGGLGMEGYRSCMAAAAPYLVLPMIQLCTSGFLAILRSVLAQSAGAGASATAIVVYQQLVSSLVLSALAFLFFRRENSHGRPRTEVSLQIVAWSFLIGLLQILMGELLLTESLHYVTATFQSVALVTIPVVVFVLAVALRRERFRFWSIGGQAKLWATVAAAAGAAVVVLTMDQDSAGSTVAGIAAYSGGLLGITIVGVAVLAEATAAVLVEKVALSFDGDLKLSAMITVFGTLQVALLAIFMERDLSAWRIKWSGSLEFLAILYGGILVNGLACFARIWCIHVKGPVFSSAFSPLMVVFSFLIQTILYGTVVQLGSIIGSVLVIGGLYVLLWAKNKDKVEKIKAEEHNLPVEEASSVAEPLLPTN